MTSSSSTQISASLATTPKRVTLLGSTGTIGQNTLSLIQQQPEQFQVTALTAYSNLDILVEQALALHPELAVIGDEEQYQALKEALQNTGIEVAAGIDAITEAAAMETDIVISAIVGAAALKPTLSAIKQGATIGLANKECLVCAGELLTEQLHIHNSQLIPIDSEHHAIFQSFDFEQPEHVERITLTASGGPFRTWKKEDMANITVAEATTHPNWAMGPKITVDSATMMNKGLEVIEAYHLFPIEKEQIDVLVHPESIVHSLTHYIDGSVIAGLSIPDMCVPISYTLGWPSRLETKVPRLDLATIGSLHFEAPDETRFEALSLAKHALYEGGTAPTILNAANEIAVESFIAGKIGFLDIINIVKTCLEQIPSVKTSSLDVICDTDQKVRKYAQRNIDELTNR